MKISREGERVIIQTGGGGELALPVEDFLAILGNAASLRDQLASSPQTRASFPLAWTIHAAKAAVQADAYREQVLLRLTDREGLETVFALSIDLAKDMSEQMGLELARIEKPPKLDG